MPIWKEMWMVRKGVFLGLLVVLCLGFWACQRSGDDRQAKNELVRINDVSISLDEFRQMSEDQSLEKKMRLISEKGLRDFLDNYVITREVLYQEAKKKGFDQKKEILAKVDEIRRMMAIDALLEETLKGKSEVSDAEVQQYYKENQRQFTEPREVRIHHLFVNSEPVLQEVRSKLAKGESFEKLASQYNIDLTRDDGGDLGFVKRGQLSPAFAQFEEVAFSLRNPGDISDVVKTPLGYHILKLEDKRGTVLRPFDQVKESIRLFLQGKKRQDAYLEYIKEAKARAKITVNEKLWAEEEKKENAPKEERK
jgi:peptidyl-prolyl cis-trans isomerase C